MDITITPGKLHGDITVIPSKSHGHRLLLGAFLAGDMDLADVPISSEDILATRDCLAALSGAKGDRPVILDCRESGSTLRFLLPLALTVAEDVIFLRRGRLSERTLSPLKEALEEKGVVFMESNAGSGPDDDAKSDPIALTQEAVGPTGGLCDPGLDMPHPLRARGRLDGGDFTFDGNVSSQFTTGLLFALANTAAGGSVTLTGTVASRPYIDLTIQVLRSFGVKVKERRTKAGFTFTVKGGQRFAPEQKPLHTEGDWSNAAFFIGANVCGSHLHIHGLDPHSVQGDKAIEELAAKIQLAEPGESLTVPVNDIPDLFPILCVMAWGTGTGLKITEAGRLRDKESDRLAAMEKNLLALGATVTTTADTLSIAPDPARRAMLNEDGREEILWPTASAKREEILTVGGAGDHRIVMAMAIAATCCDRPLTITGAEAVRKSWPGFFEAYEKLGGRTTRG